MRLRNLAVCVVVFALVGCEKWEKVGGTKEEFEAMKGACGARAYSQYPPMMQQIQLTAGYTTPVQTTCTGFGYSVNCISTGGQYVPPAMMTVDRNDGARTQATRSCFFENGWHPSK